ncbi:OTU domain-containing protein [Endozoicomonas sp. SCSIO W0465]|uniref:OTU domain-containing protein n=1 Tax=Endozoicomonas sp. SCSIO W0465 TaxID=2918516 RepID=UPI00207599AC|nr:OTU domain-containing protein [Endozoicomonas sp. SCSIO W0465]USE39477.1 hypothetical protein MJO57_15730 [Endozoicomonas sp. SCSIO W0465]
MAVSFFASSIAAIIAASAVTVVLGIAVIGYFSHHNDRSSNAPQLDIEPPATLSAGAGNPAAAPIQPPPYNTSYAPPPPYSPYASPPPGYTSFGIPASEVTNPYELPPTYKEIGSEKFIRMQEANVDYLLRQHGESIYRSSRDGNCLYDSAAHQCPEIARDATDLRHQVGFFARNWQQRYQHGNINFSPIEARAYARLQGDVSYEAGDTVITNGLEEIETPGCFSDHIDTFFLAQVARMPVIVIDTDNNVTIAVDENGRSMDWLETYDRNLVPSRKILLVRDGPHFMGRNLEQN